MASFTNTETYEIGKRQKAILWLILLSIFLIFIPKIGPILSAVINIMFVYKLAVALKSKVAWLWCLLMIVPLVSLISLLIINGKATTALRTAGIKVGLMGANKAQLEGLLSNE